jgi:predicted  nucleic acid-binding Zn-ribbon protein
MEIVWASAVTGAFGVLMLLIEKGRRENVRDHGFVKDRLDSIKEDIADIDDDISNIEAKIDTHLNNHITNQFNLENLKFKTGEKVKAARDNNGSKKR